MLDPSYLNRTRLEIKKRVSDEYHYIEYYTIEILRIILDISKIGGEKEIKRIMLSAYHRQYSGSHYYGMNIGVDIRQYNTVLNKIEFRAFDAYPYVSDNDEIIDDYSGNHYILLRDFNRYYEAVINEMDRFYGSDRIEKEPPLVRCVNCFRVSVQSSSHDELCEECSVKLEKKRQEAISGNNFASITAVFTDELYTLGFTSEYRIQRNSSHIRVDFFNEDKKIIVEIDGDEHFSSKKRREDIKRDRFLAMKFPGFRILRFSKRELEFDPNKCLNEIHAFLSVDI